MSVVGLSQIKSVHWKLGNMRKADDWTIYPRPNANDPEVTIQCDKRIARVNLDTKQGILSTGKGGHQGFAALSPMFNPIPITLTDEQVAELREKTVVASVVRLNG